MRITIKKQIFILHFGFYDMTTITFVLNRLYINHSFAVLHLDSGYFNLFLKYVLNWSNSSFSAASLRLLGWALMSGVWTDFHDVLYHQAQQWFFIKATALRISAQTARENKSSVNIWGNVFLAYTVSKADNLLLLVHVSSLSNVSSAAVDLVG